MIEKMSVKIKDDIILVKYEIWKKIKKALDIKFHSKPAYDEKYIKAKVKTFSGVVNTVFSDNKIPNECIYYSSIAAINEDSVTRIDKRNYPQVYLKECKYEKKKKKMVKFIDVEFDLDDSDDSDDSYSEQFH